MRRNAPGGAQESEKKDMNSIWKRAAKTAALCAAAWAMSGCIALPMWRRTEYAEWAGEAKRVGEGHVTAAQTETWAEGRGGGRMAVGVRGKGELEWDRQRPVYRVDAVKWKWLSAGVFPGMAESIWRSEKSLQPLPGRRYVEAGSSAGGQVPPMKRSVGGVVLSWLFWTPVAMPFELLGFVPSECNSHHWGGKNAVLLTKFPAAKRKVLGAWTWWDDSAGVHQRPVKSAYTHYMLVGFHRYCTYRIGDVKEVEPRGAEPERERREWRLEGPFDMDVAVAGADDKKWTKTQRVAPGETETLFDLPPWARGRVKAKVRVRVAEERIEEEPDALRQAFLAAADQSVAMVEVQVREGETDTLRWMSLDSDRPAEGPGRD